MPENDLKEDILGPSPPNVSGTAEKAFFDSDRAAHEHNMRKLELGYVGLIFGGGSEKSGNIALITIIIVFLLLLFIFYRIGVAANGDLLIKIASPLLSIITLALGYLFGSSRKG
jgi:hypothetical protein